MLIDRFGRAHTSLRISVTDRCNLRCTYCMPADTPDYQDRSQVLTFEEILRFVRIAISLGVDNVRLTGGEPLVRSELHVLIKMIRRLDGLQKVSLTTNGVLLPDQLDDLFRAGLRHLNVSLDALDEGSFHEATRRGGLPKVLDGINRAKSMGVNVKINSIAMRGFTERQIQAFGTLARDTNIPVRFIEYMPLDADGNWDTSRVLSGRTVVDLFSKQVMPLVSMPREDSAPSTDYQFEDGKGTIGIITSVTQPFCDTCNRFRLTADGQIRNCLFGEDSGDVKSLLRGNASDETIAELIRGAVTAKKAGHGSDDLSFRRPSRPMYSIGG